MPSIFRGISDPSFGVGQSVESFVQAAINAAVAEAFSVRDIQILNLQQRVTNLETDTGGGGVTPPAPTPPPAPSGVVIDINFADIMTGDTGPLSITGVNFTRASNGYVVFDHEGTAVVPESGELYIAGGRRNDAGTGDFGWGAAGIQWFSDDAEDGAPIASDVLLGFRPKPGCVQLCRYNRHLEDGWTLNDGAWSALNDAKVGDYTRLSALQGSGVSMQFSNATPGGDLGLAFMARQNGGATGTISLQNLIGPAGGRWYINTALLPQSDADFAVITRDHEAVTVDQEFFAQAGDGFIGLRILDASAEGTRGLDITLITLIDSGSNDSPYGLVENTTNANVTIADEVFYIDNAEVNGTAGTFLFTTDAPATDGSAAFSFDQSGFPGLDLRSDGSVDAVLSSTENSGVPADTDYFSVALAFDGNGFSSAINQDAVLDTGATAMPSLTGDLYLGESNGGSYLRRPFKRFAYWDSRLTDAELETLAQDNYLPGGASGGGGGDTGTGDTGGGDTGGGDPVSNEILLANPNTVLMQYMQSNDATSSNARFGWRPWARNGPTVQVCSWAAIASACSDGRGDLTTYAGGADHIVAWTWLNKGITAGVYTEPRVAGLSAYILDKRDDQWKKVWGPLGLGAGQLWNGSDGIGVFDSMESRGTTSGGAPISAPKASVIDNYGFEPWQSGHASAVGAQISTDLIQNAKCYAVVGWAKVAMRPGEIIDARGSDVWFVQQGFDIMNSKHPAYPSHTVRPGSSFSRPPDTYPGSAIDGGNAGWYQIPYSADNPERWYPFGVISITDSSQVGLYRNPWAAAVGVQPWTTPSAHANVGGITSAQFLNSGFVMPAI